MAAHLCGSNVCPSYDATLFECVCAAYADSHNDLATHLDGTSNVSGLSGRRLVLDDEHIQRACHMHALWAGDANEFARSSQLVIKGDPFECTRAAASTGDWRLQTRSI